MTTFLIVERIGAALLVVLALFSIPGFLVLSLGGPLWLALATGVFLAVASMLLIRTITRRMAALSEPDT
ncbi:hypothetical protein IV500_05780 [Paeniglutamicibacter antarcticus]|uniref:Uncharacterized protein n=1 Tax=Arthrobacter terrae TaxID=2935737 RepID=A0A931CL28_9MICC|nr:hypothetical protein [Arthrobacter terrae]MBG0738932.1 hypothetical protein [Arthrobacter terrae]